MANKRIKKKKQKQLIQKKAVQYNITEKPQKINYVELEKLVKNEEKRIKRNEQQNARRKARFDYAKNKGIPEDIIRKNKLQNLGQESLDKFIRKYKENELADRKFSMLLAKGYSEQEARKLSKKLSLKNIRDMEYKRGTVKTSKEYLTVLWYDPTRENTLSGGLLIVQAMNEFEKKDLIRRTKEAKNRKKTSYEKFLGDFQAAKGSLAYCNRFLSRARHLKERYEEILMPTNKFTYEGIENLLATMSQLLVPNRIADFYDYMEIFVRDNFPEWLDIFK